MEKKPLPVAAAPQWTQGNQSSLVILWEVMQCQEPEAKELLTFLFYLSVHVAQTFLHQSESTRNVVGGEHSMCALYLTFASVFVGERQGAKRKAEKRDGRKNLRCWEVQIKKAVVNLEIRGRCQLKGSKWSWLFVVKTYTAALRYKWIRWCVW